MRATHALLLLSGFLPAQVFVVDAANGPGAHYTSIAAAVAAVPDGAVLQVRAGVYAGFTITQKSLAVLAEPGVLVSDLLLPPIRIDAIGAGQRVVLRGLHIANQLGQATISCQGSAGTILLDACRGDAGTSSIGGGVFAMGCAQLHLRGCTFHALPTGAVALDLAQCSATALGCSLSSTFGPPVRLSGGRLDLVGCDVRAGVWPPAVVMTGADLDVRGGSTLQASGQPPAGIVADGSGQVRIDPNTTLLNTASPGFGAGLVVTTPTMPALFAWPDGPGGAASATLFGPAGGVGALLVGAPGAPYAPAGLLDLAWILPGTAVPNAVGSATLTGGYAVPNAPWVLGVTLCWQGVTFAPGSGLQLSNAAASAHG